MLFRPEGRVTPTRLTASDHSSFSLLNANWRDARDIRALEKTCFGADAWSYFEIYYSLFFSKVRLKAVTHHGLVGLVLGESHSRSQVGLIASIAVHPLWQGQGIGRALLAACEAQFTEPTIKLTVRADNHRAIDLYEKFGYQRIDIWAHYYAGGKDGIVMEKRR